MLETQREPVPRIEQVSSTQPLTVLSFARHCVLKKADRISDEQLRRVMVQCHVA
jgi:hypothetical protein